jgi:Putative transposase
MVRAPLPAGTGTVRSANRKRVNIGSRLANASSSPPATSTSCSPCRTNSMCWRWTTRAYFTTCCLPPSAQTLLKVARDPKHLGAEIGVISILHTWGQNLLLHPHIHCAIPAGGLSLDHSRWIRPRYPFFLPVKVLSRVFRGKFLAGLKRFHRRQQLRCAGPAVALADPKQFRRFLRQLHRQDWVVYAKPAFGGPTKVLRYLGRYTHRIAISNHRLLAFDGEGVTFRWKDYAHGGKQRTMTLLGTEFLRRFFLHVLPKGFVRIRYFGFLANRIRARCLPLCQQLLASDRPPPSSSSETTSNWHCPNCGAAMIVTHRLTAGELSRCIYFDTS